MPAACGFRLGRLRSRGSRPLRWSQVWRTEPLDLGLENKVALVAGGSSGIGLAVATELAREGARVAIGARGEDQLKLAAQGLAKIAPGRGRAAGGGGGRRAGGGRIS